VLAENEAFVQELLIKHAGMALVDEQRHVLDARLASLARLQNLDNADTLVGRLRSRPSGVLLDSVIEALTTHETTFFRDASAFRALSEHVLPDLIRRRRQQRTLSIWSAGCSTGQEAYSVAILLRERFPDTAGWRLRLWGTDVSRSTLARAREGRFSELELRRGLSTGAREKYFTPMGAEYRINEDVRRMVSWEMMNLAAPWPSMSAFDLILMRNVLIYLTADARARVLALTASHLFRDGYLLLGTSETTFGASQELVPFSVQGATLYRRSGR